MAATTRKYGRASSLPPTQDAAAPAYGRSSSLPAASPTTGSGTDAATDADKGTQKKVARAASMFDNAYEAYQQLNDMINSLLDLGGDV